MDWSPVILAIAAAIPGIAAAIISWINRQGIKKLHSMMLPRAAFQTSANVRSVADCWEEAKRVVGPPPSPPEFRDVPSPNPEGDTGGVLGGDTKINPIQPPNTSPENNLLLQQYQAELQLYNTNLQAVFQALLAGK